MNDFQSAIRRSSRSWQKASPKLLAGCIALAAVAACAPTRTMTLANAPTPSVSYVVDSTEPDDHPSFSAGEGNIYSCRYGIAFQKSSEFVPPKAQMFEALLFAEWPEAASHEVVLHRFDVYNNLRLKLLSGFGAVMGGAVGAAISASADKASGSQLLLDRLVVHVDPDPAFVPDDENPVGCNGRGEGEYFASQISTGHSVVVTWLRFDVDGQPYHLRTFYPYQEEKPEGFDRAKLEAVRLSVRAAAQLVRGEG